MRYFITGCAGFIGSNLTDKLLQAGHEIVGFDNFSTGMHEFLEDAKASSRFSLIEADLLDRESLAKAMQGCEFVFHLAANADVRFGINHTDKDLKQNTIATFNVLEAMNENNISKIAFASTGSIYGETTAIPTPENAPFPIQTSLYGASKLAAEGLIQAYSEAFNFQSYIFRFVSILGERYTHGHIFDFYSQLIKDPSNLTILGDGQQRKSYLYVQDCLDAMLHVIETTHEKVTIVNLGTDEYCKVDHSAAWICEQLRLQPRKSYTGGERGWIGDNPFIYLETSKVRSLGWQPKFSIKQAVIRTVEYLQANEWLLQKR